MTFANGHALLIGVGAYRHLPQLDVPLTAADARSVAAALRDPQLCGYPDDQVALLCDATATRAGILGALDDLAARTSEHNTIFMFYSGHGHSGEDGSYYLTSHDTSLTQSRQVAAGTGVSQQELLTRLQALKAQRVLLIFNACHSGALTPTLAVEEPFTGESLPDATSAALLATGAGRIIITACREQQYSFVGGGERTIFAQALLDGLRGQGTTSQRGYISAFDLYTQLYFAVGDAVRQQVPEAVRQRYGATQEPELTVLKGVGPFAVALYRGAATLGDFAAPPLPAPGTALREVSAEDSRALFQQIIQGSTIYQGPVTQVAGPQRNVSTGGGDYVEGNLQQQGVFISGGTVHGTVIGTMAGGTVIVSSGASTPAGVPSTIALAELLAQVRAAAAQSKQHGDADSADELERIALDLAAALRAQDSGDTSRRQAKLGRAQQDLDSLAQSQPELRALAQALRRVE
jgi:hypothetical protein